MLQSPCATLAMPTAGQCLVVVAPFLGLLALRWLVRNIDQIVERLFPHTDWERQLGWLNLRAHRRAERVLRWLGYLVYATLALALYGILWSAPVLGRLAQGNNPSLFTEIDLKIPILLLCLSCWLIYLSCELIPKLRRKEEQEELEAFRAEQVRLENSSERTPSRLSPTQIKIWDTSLPAHQTKSRL